MALSEMVTALGLSTGAELIAATRTGFGIVDAQTGHVRDLAGPLIGHPEDRMNDGAIAPDGSFWAGSCAPDTRPGTSS